MAGEMPGPSGERLDARAESWSTQQLVEFSTLISSIQNESAAMTHGADRIAEALEAEVAALIRPDGTVEAAVGYTQGQVPVALLMGVAQGRSATLEVPGAGSCPAAAVTIEDDRPLQIVVARVGEPFSPDELGLLRGMGRILALGLRNLALLGTERSLREASEQQAGENALLLAELRERQTLLERLAQLQRSIVERQALHEVLEAVARTAAELLGDDIVGLRIRDPGDPSQTTLAATVGLGAGADVVGPASAEEGLGARAIRERRLIVVDAASGIDVGMLGEELQAAGAVAAMAAPVNERDEIMGSLTIGSRRPGRVYGPREQQVMLSLAEHASLALNHARAVEESVHEALHDSLTGLPNRSLFLDRLEHALTRARRSGVPVGVLFCDLDGFKTVNDSLGHGAGDQLLVRVADRLANAMRPADTIARLGGDEFAVLLEEAHDPGESARIARRVLEALEPPFDARGREVFLTASIGIATGTGDGETLLRNADLAMYRAKSRGRGGYAVFEPEMHRAVVDRLELELDLKRAIDRGELLLAYQPICDIRSGAVVGLEALVRWQHPTRGLVTAGRFVPLAEESGDIAALGRWVLRAATQQAALWRARYPAHAGLQLGVNVSGLQLHGEDLAREVADALQRAQLDGSGLTLEITETVLMRDFDAAVRQLEAVKALGVDVAIDDFGTGYSSLRYLRRLPLDNLKVDKSFVAGIGGPEEEPALVRAIVDLATAFDLSVVAEGIETEAQRKRLLELGCGMGQGHLFAPALPADEADGFLLGAGLLSERAEQEEVDGGAGREAEEEARRAED
jgi:diguanylate cyclase (GGDEF)-like protein